MIWTAVLGLAIIGYDLHQIFEDLFHPSGSGSLSEYIARAYFGLFRRAPALLPAAGPLAVVTVITAWTALIVIGFALIFFHRLPVPREHFLAALRFSLTSVTTLGSPDLPVSSHGILILASLESLLGLALITASVSGVVLIYPALRRLRTLARRADSIRTAEDRTGLDTIGCGADSLLADLVFCTIQTQVDFVHFPVIYYFYAQNRSASLPAALQCLDRIAESGSDPSVTASIRLAAAALRIAVDNLASLVDQRFLHTGSSDTATVFRAYADHHLLS